MSKKTRLQTTLDALGAPAAEDTESRAVQFLEQLHRERASLHKALATLRTAIRNTSPSAEDLYAGTAEVVARASRDARLLIDSINLGGTDGPNASSASPSPVQTTVPE